MKSGIGNDLDVKIFLNNNNGFCYIIIQLWSQLQNLLDMFKY